MDVSICANRTVADVVAAYPRTAASFIALKTNCADCHLARFCTLEDVARIYELELHDLVRALQEVAQLSQKE